MKLQEFKRWKKGEGMKIGEKISFWCWLGMDEGDVLQGTLLAIDGDVATVMTGGKKIKVFTNYIY